IEDNFFKLGGDSLAAISIISEINSEFMLKEKISINKIFKFPTIKQLSKEIDTLIQDVEIYEI
ncbi:TPA: hypothetical protein VHC99_001392, partial [Streptococcus pyogenes]|nr:hypothetical protein [Streptococcus pyogenes]